jgi:hypothetical protein
VAGGVRGADARRGGRRHRRHPRAAREPRPHLVRRRLPRPVDVPRRADGGAPARARGGGRRLRVPVRADARPRRHARRARGAARHAPGPAARRRGAARHERRHRGARARREVVPRPRRRRRRRGADLPRRDHGVPVVRGRRPRRPARRRWPRRRRARRTPRPRPAPEAPLHDPGPPEPGRADAVARAARGARRACAALRVPRRRGRRLPGARLRRHGVAEPVEPRARRRRPGGDDLEDVLPRRAPRLGRRPGGGGGAARLREAEHRPVLRRARPAALRGVRAPRLDRRAARAVARAVRAQVRASPRGARGVDARRRALDDAARRLLLVADAPGLDAVELAGRAVERGVAVVPGTLFFPDGRGRDSLRLSFSLVDEDRIAEGIERLGSLV